MLLGSDWTLGSDHKSLRYCLNTGLENERVLFGGAWKSGVTPCSWGLGSSKRWRWLGHWAFFTAILVQTKALDPG